MVQMNILGLFICKMRRELVMVNISLHIITCHDCLDMADDIDFDKTICKYEQIREPFGLPNLFLQFSCYLLGNDSHIWLTVNLLHGG